jgi:hypothetical protein
VLAPRLCGAGRFGLGPAATFGRGYGPDTADVQIALTLGPVVLLLAIAPAPRCGAFWQVSDDPSAIHRRAAPRHRHHVGHRALIAATILVGSFSIHDRSIPPMDPGAPPNVTTIGGAR